LIFNTEIEENNDYFVVLKAFYDQVF